MRHQYTGVLRYVSSNTKTLHLSRDRRRGQIKSIFGPAAGSYNRTHTFSHGYGGVTKRRTWSSSRVDSTSGDANTYDRPGTWLLAGRAE